MSNIAIKVEDLGKLYRLGQIGTGTISHDLNRWWARMRGKEDPFAKIGETNDRTKKGTSEYVWSLKDINFEVKQGEALGIIGRNGAGKSTLLKLLSKVTSPTTGRIKINGRIASLLEVGTGFHPELTGRENIFLNGAILGMSKAEIKSKFDAIVDFSGVERYIDTPVTRYSSGMYVRLAIAVAAYLESEILIVDEVLAVGDAEFQRKCLGKMNEVRNGQGRTVLFVSHNMASLRSLCNTGILLKNGNLIYGGDIEETMINYNNLSKIIFENNERKTSYIANENLDKPAQILSVRVVDGSNTEKPEFDVWESIYIEYEFAIRAPSLQWVTPIINVEKDGIELFWSFASDKDETILEKWEPGIYKYKVKLPSPLKKGHYKIKAKLGKLRVGDIDTIPIDIEFMIDEFTFDPTNVSYASARPGLIPAILHWENI